MRNSSVHLVWILSLGLGGCSAPGEGGGSGDIDPAEVPSSVSNLAFSIVRDPGATMPQEGVFDFVVLSIPDDPQLEDREEIKDRVQTAIVRELESKGYTHGGSDPVFLVGLYTLGTRLDTDEAVESNLERPEWLCSLDDEIGALRTAVVLDIVDAATKKPIYRGVCSADILPNVTEEEKETRTSVAIRRLLAQFPSE